MKDLHIRLTDQAYEKLRKDLKKSKLSQNAYMSKVILEKHITEKPDKDLTDMLHDFYELLNAPEKSATYTQKVCDFIFRIEKKYIYGDD